MEITPQQVLECLSDRADPTVPLDFPLADLYCTELSYGASYVPRWALGSRSRLLARGTLTKLTATVLPSMAASFGADYAALTWPATICSAGANLPEYMRTPALIQIAAHLTGSSSPPKFNCHAAGYKVTDTGLVTLASRAMIKLSGSGHDIAHEVISRTAQGLSWDGDILPDAAAEIVEATRSEPIWFSDAVKFCVNFDWDY